MVEASTTWASQLRMRSSKSMGAATQVISGEVDCGYTVIPGSNIHPHQITSGLSDITVACLSPLSLGPNDYALFTSVQFPGDVLAAVAKVDLTPLPPPTNLVAPGARVAPTLPVVRPRDPQYPLSLGRWTCARVARPRSRHLNY